MNSTELLQKVSKIWTGKELLAIRELEHKLNIFQIKDILLNSNNIFLTKDEILYNAMKLKSDQVKKDIDLTYFCTGCKEINEDNVNIKIDEIPFQERKDNENIEIQNVKITSKEPNRSVTLDINKNEPNYDLDEMLECLEFENLPEGKSKKDFVLDLHLKDFSMLEIFYNETKFRFQPVISIKCPKCEKITKINIDTFPMEGMG